MKPTSLHFTSLIRIDKNNLYPLQLIVPSETVISLKNLSTKRFKARILGNKPISVSLLPKGEGVYFFKLNQSLLKEWKLKIGDQVDVVVTPDDSKYGIDLPEEFAAIWEVDKLGSDYFHALTPGKQRNLLHLVAKVKNPDLRAKKAMIIMEYLKLNKGKLDFKALNEALRS